MDTKYTIHPVQRITRLSDALEGRTTTFYEVQENGKYIAGLFRTKSDAQNWIAQWGRSTIN